MGLCAAESTSTRQAVSKREYILGKAGTCSGTLASAYSAIDITGAFSANDVHNGCPWSHRLIDKTGQYYSKMSLTFRRLASTSSKASASEAAAEILQRFGNKPISVREQLLDANQARLFSLTFGRQKLHPDDKLSADGAPLKGTPLPPGYHWAYFTPPFLEQDLGEDGTDKTLNPLRPWTRRMWAGGELQWRQGSAELLRVGSTVTEITRIVSAEAKTMRNGDSMILAGLEKTYESDNGIGLVDKR